MKKIIAAFDGLKFSESTKKYALKLANESDSLLTGIFLDDFTYHSYKLFDLVGSQGISPEKVKQLMDKDAQTRKQAVLNFKQSCKTAQLRHIIHHDKGIAIQELLRESIYSDLLIIASNETLTHYKEELPTAFIRDLLTDVQCPVLLVPTVYKNPKKIVLLYDGSPSSVYTVKIFSYILPWLKDLPVEVVSVKPTNEQRSLPENKLIKEFISCHYPKARYILLEGDPEVEILNYLKNKRNELVALGAYHRSMISRWFKESIADLLMKNTQLPLFIAHYR